MEHTYHGKTFDAKEHVDNNKLYDLVTLKVDNLEGSKGKGDALAVKTELLDYVANIRAGLYTKNICMDIRSAKTIDSTGLSAILIYNRINKNVGADTLKIICEANSPIERLINICQLDTVLEMYNDLSELKGNR